MSVVDFSRFRRYRPPPVSREQARTAELEALQIKLLQAQIRETELSNRILGQLWLRRCLRGVLFWGIVLWLLTHFVHAASAESSISRSFYNGNGTFAGSSVTRGKSTSFYDHQGRFAGSSINYGRSTSFYDGRGRFTGSSINTGPRR
jgi:hypothetical protein